MTIEVKNVRQTKKMNMKADMEFNTVALVQLWDKCEDAKTYISRLNGRIDEAHYSAKWEKLATKAMENVFQLSEEITFLLHTMGAFNALKRPSKTYIKKDPLSYFARAPQRDTAASAKPKY